MRKKSPGWPQYLEQKRSGRGLRYFWNAPSWARKRGYSVKSEPLGADYTAAKARCDDYLNPMFEAWRTGGDAKRIAPAGSVDWMFAEYKGSKKYTKLPARTRSGYDRAMGDVADYILKDGRRVGELHVKSVNAEFVDKIYDKLKIGPDGTPRNRSALLSITVCKLAWNVVHRNKPAIVPEVNPFKGVDIDYEPKHNRAATLAELMQFVRAADKDGTLSIGTAALLAFYWLVREEDIFTRMAWSDYRPGEQPNHVLVWHHKNRKSAKIPLPLLDVDGTELWPEMTARLDGMTRTGTLIVMRDNLTRARRCICPG